MPKSNFGVRVALRDTDERVYQLRQRLETLEKRFAALSEREEIDVSKNEPLLDLYRVTREHGACTTCDAEGNQCRIGFLLAIIKMRDETIGYW